MSRSVKLCTVAFLAVVLAMAMIGPAHATVTTITPSNADTYLTADSPTLNWGTSNVMRILSSGATWYRVLVEFDLSSIPSGSTINTASLQLYYEGVVNAPVGRTYTANRVTTNWVEGNGNGGGTTGATWNKPDQSQTPTWTTDGGDYTTTGAASQVVPATFGYMTWDVTAIVKGWIEGGQPNYGFLMKDLNENVGGTVGAYFWAREHGSFMPILTVDYTPHVGAPVGGFMQPVNKLTIAAPYLTLFGLVAAVAVVVWKKREN